MVTADDHGDHDGAAEIAEIAEIVEIAEAEFAGWMGGAGRRGGARHRPLKRRPAVERTYRFHSKAWNPAAGGIEAGMLWTVKNPALLGGRPVRFFCYGMETGALGRVSVAKVDDEPLFFINGWGWDGAGRVPARPGAFTHLAGWTEYTDPGFTDNLAEQAAYRIYGDHPEEEVEREGRRVELPSIFLRHGIDLGQLFTAYRAYVEEDDLFNAVRREARDRGLLGFLNFPDRPIG